MLSHSATAGNAANAASSNVPTNPVDTTSLPSEVIQCLENARFLHLATCTNNHPHVSLMNYTYLPTSPYTGASPVVVMTSDPRSKKFENLVANPNVSLLVHDWVSHRPPNSRRLSGGSAGVGPGAPEETRSSLATLLLNLNTSSISSISATINGVARLVDRGTEEESFLRGKHLENNVYDSGSAGAGGGGMTSGGLFGTGENDRRRENEAGRCFVEGDAVRVIVVKIEDVRISDWQGGVSEWNIVERGGGADINGIR